MTSHVTEVINDFIMKVELKSSFQECFSKQDETPFSLVLAAEASSLHSLWPAARDYSKLIMAGDRVTDPVDNKASQQSLVSKPYLSFSIENILRSPGTFGAQKPRRSETPEKRQIGNNDTTGMIHEETLQTRLPWLAYTRYCPPKLPSKLLVVFNSVEKLRSQWCSFLLSFLFVCVCFVFTFLPLSMQSLCLKSTSGGHRPKYNFT